MPTSAANPPDGESPPIDVNNNKKVDHEKNKKMAAAKPSEESPPTGAKAASPSPRKRRHPQRKELPVSVWYDACKQFMDNHPTKYNTQMNFLRSADSGVLDETNKMSFSKRLKAYKAGKLPQDDSIKRVRIGKYRDVEQCLIAFIETRTKFSKGKTAVSWPFLIELSKRFAAALGYSEEEFRASPGWLSNVLKRNKKCLTDDIDDDDILVYLESIKRFCKKKKLGKDIEAQCDGLYKAIRKVAKDEEVDSVSDKNTDRVNALHAQQMGAQDLQFRFQVPGTFPYF